MEPPAPSPVQPSCRVPTLWHVHCSLSGVGGQQFQPRKLEGIRVLLTEDDPDTREVLALGLELQGASVVAVGSAGATLRALREGTFDVLLSDIGLPDEDGLSLIRRVRRLPPDVGGRVPAAVVTAFTLADDGRAARNAGFQRHFRKPVDTASLFEAVAELARLGRVERRKRSRDDHGPGGGSALRRAS